MEGHTITRGELEHRFQNHPADQANQPERYTEIQQILVDAADRIVQLTGGPSREQSTTITKLEEAFFWAKADLDRKDGPRV